MKTLLHKLGLMIAFAALIVSLFLIGQASAQTTCSADQVMCYPSGSGTGGWCQMPPCPTNDTSYTPPASTYTPPAPTTDPQTQCTSQGYKWCSGSSGGSGWCTYSTTGTCPANDATSCSAQNGKWCKNSDGATGWCSSDANYKCPAYDSASCTTEGGEWCSSQYGSGWCAYASQGSSCPINDQATCTAKGRSWCTPQYGGSGWCTSSATEKCPAYNEADCKAQSKIWCVSPGSATTSGWCTDSCPYSTTTPTDAKTTCTNSNYKWCLNSDGATGWCSYNSTATYQCPAYDSASCKAQNGEWCAYTSGTGGWCATGNSSCPINDKATCEAKGRKWCTSTYGSGWCTASATETCPSSSTPTTPPPTTPVSFGWPKTQSECESYYGLWCKSDTSYTIYSSGSCMTANQKCWETSKPGYMTCWDNTQVPSGSSCLATPITKTDCTTKGYNWCDTTASSSSGSSYSSGWCSATSCPVMSPAGKMTCPDGKSFAATLSECPKKSTPAPEPIYTQCPDGTKVPVGAGCPASYTCPNGVIVKSSEQCSETEDPVNSCLNKGGQWCYNNQIHGAKSGWCAPSGSTCAKTVEPIPQPQPEPIPIPLPEPKFIEREKKDMLRELRMMERFFKKGKNESMLTKIGLLKEKIEKVDAKSKDVYDVMQTLRDMMEDMREAYRDAMDNQGDVDERERDEKFLKRALRDMKNGARKLERFLKIFDAKVQRVEKGGITVDPAIKETAAKAAELAKQAKAAKTYDEIKDIMEQLPDLMEDLNEFMPRLETLSRLPKIFKLLNLRVADATRLVKQTAAAAKRLKFDATEELQKMESLLADMKAAVEQLKSGNFEEDIWEFIEANILDKYQEMQQIADNLRNVAAVKKYLNKANADLKRFDKRIKQLERKKEDMEEAKMLLDELKMHVEELRASANQKMTEEVAIEIIEHLRSITDLTQQLEESLKIVTISDLEKQLRRSLRTGGENFSEFKVENIEKLMVKSFHTANFFRLSPQQGLALLLK